MHVAYGVWLMARAKNEELMAYGLWHKHKMGSLWLMAYCI